MRAYQRKQLKQDSFTQTAKETVSWAVENRNQLIWTVAIIAVAACIYLAYWYTAVYRDDQASALFSSALQTYQAPLRAEGEPVVPGVPSFATAKERAGKAQEQFQAIASRYGFTRTGKLARYFLGLTDMDLGDNNGAERELKEVAGSGSKDTAALAKFALAALYRQTNRADEAIALYKQLIDHPTNTVPKATAQLELASVYEAKQPAEAKKIYEDVQKADPRGAAAEIATTKLQSLK